jgi:hypothetical protein
LPPFNEDRAAVPRVPVLVHAVCHASLQVRNGCPGNSDDPSSESEDALTPQGVMGV